MAYIKAAYIIAIGISFFASLKAFRLNGLFHLKFFSALLGLTFLVELTAAYILKLLHIKGWVNPLYDVFMLVEFCAYAFYYRQILDKKYLSLIVLCILPAGWLIIKVLVTDKSKWDGYFFTAGACCTVFLIVTYFLQLLKSPEPVKVLRQPEFVIATGMLIFYSCMLPYLGPLNYLVNQYSDTAYAFLAVLRIFDIIMYSLFTYAFVCQVTTKR